MYRNDLARAAQKFPVVAVIGGDADEEKFCLVDRLLEKADAILLGGGISAAFLKARGGKLGRSPLSSAQVERACALLEELERRGVKIFLPIDSLAANEISPNSKPSLEGAMALFEDKIPMDIGPRTVELFRNVILTAGTVIWNGPMGIFELPAFSSGTREIVHALAETKAGTIVCGGGSIEAAKRFGEAERMTHLFLTSGALLQFLEEYCL